METKRAQEIAASPVMAHVTYNGTQVYIQNVDEMNNMARVYALKNPQEEQEVPVNRLEEH